MSFVRDGKIPHFKKREILPHFNRRNTYIKKKKGEICFFKKQHFSLYLPILEILWKMLDMSEGRLLIPCILRFKEQKIVIFSNVSFLTKLICSSQNEKNFFVLSFLGEFYSILGRTTVECVQFVHVDVPSIRSLLKIVNNIFKNFLNCKYYF